MSRSVSNFAYTNTPTSWVFTLGWGNYIAKKESTQANMILHTFLGVWRHMLLQHDLTVNMLF